MPGRAERAMGGEALTWKLVWTVKISRGHSGR